MFDIFEDFKKYTGCLYISDLRNYKIIVEKKLFNIELNKYEIKQIYDLCDYVFNCSFLKICRIHFNNMGMGHEHKS